MPLVVGCSCSCLDLIPAALRGKGWVIARGGKHSVVLLTLMSTIGAHWYQQFWLSRYYYEAPIPQLTKGRAMISIPPRKRVCVCVCVYVCVRWPSESFRWVASSVH